MDIYESFKPYFPAWTEEETEETKDNEKSANWLYRDCLADTPDLLFSDSEDSSGGYDDFPSRLSPGALHTGCWGGSSDRHVRFGTAEVREHAVTIGDHPSCCGALPLTLDWEHADDKIYEIDEFEDMRSRKGGRKGRRGRPPKLDFWSRRDVLQRVGPLAEMEREIVEDSKHVILQELRENESLFVTNGDAVENTHVEVEYGSGFGFGFPVMKVQILED